MKGAWRVVSGLLVFWLLILVYMSTTLYQSGDVSLRTERQLQKALLELDALKKQNDELHKLARELKDLQATIDVNEGAGGRLGQLQNKLKEANMRLEKMSQAGHGKPGPVLPQIQQPLEFIETGGGGDVSLTGVAAPGLEHEKLRRRVENGVLEEWFYLQGQISQVKDAVKDKTEVVVKLNNMLKNAADHHMTIMNDLHNMSISNGAGDWRQKEAQELSDIVQARIQYLQNPSDCSEAKKLVCNINKGCGYGCQLHHVVYCFMIAFGLERTMVLDSRGWRYSSGGWDKVFKPISDTCLTSGNARAWGPPETIKDAKDVALPIVDSLHPRTKFMPLAIPKDLAPRLLRLHGNPSVWFIGQFLKYLLVPSKDLAADIESTKQRLKFKSPIVGVHVRRTDKVGTEAAFHSIDEYMLHVDKYYDQLEKRQKVDQRRIFLATDDPLLLQEAKFKYSNYEIISENSFSQSAGLSSRYTDSSLRGIVMDIHFLALSDYLVCTFSSQVCRVAYEIMQTYHADASAYFHSLDDVYYFGGQNAHNLVALYPHKAQSSDEIDLSPGDLVGIAGNHWNGYSKGTNQNTRKTGLFPSFKVAENFDIVEFPTYPDADKGR